MTYSINTEKKYWTNYYKNHKHAFEPSLFSKSITKFLNEGDSLIDLGCGNGRDAIYFAEKNIYTHGVDMVSEEIEYLNKLYKNHKYLSFATCNFADLPNKKFTHAYSRFSLHSIPPEIEKILFNWIKNNIKKYFFLEVRSDKDSLYKKNTDHYRRFHNFEILLMDLLEKNFKIKYSEISENFAPYNNNYGVDYNENSPEIIRIVCSPILFDHKKQQL